MLTDPLLKPPIQRVAAGRSQTLHEKGRDREFLPGSNYIPFAELMRGGWLLSVCRSIHPRICDLIPL